MYACLLFLHVIDDLMVHCVLCSYIMMAGRPRTSKRLFFSMMVLKTPIFQNLILVSIRHIRQSFVV